MKEEGTRIKGMQRRNTVVQLPLRILQEKNHVIVVFEPKCQWLQGQCSMGLFLWAMSGIDVGKENTTSDS